MNELVITLILLSMFGIYIEFNKEKKNGKKILSFILLFIGSTLIGVGSNPASDMPNGSQTMVTCGMCLSVIGLIIFTTTHKFKNKIYYIIPITIIIILIFSCSNKLNNWDVAPTSKGNGCYPNKPYYVCENYKRSDGTTYQKCRCKAIYD